MKEIHKKDVSSSLHQSKTERLKNIRELCIQNAEYFVIAAKKLKNNGLHHIQYHLAVLSLEEIGKAELLGMEMAAGLNQRQPVASSTYEDHIKKLFWALWGPSFSKEVIKKEQIEQYRGLANLLHFTRLESLYVNPNENVQPKSKVSQKEADNVTTIAEARVGMEKNEKMLDPNDPNINKSELKWFLEVTDDPEKRTLIFGKKSQEKLIEFGNVRDWIHWLKEQFDKNDAEIKKLVGEELGRQKPSKKEARQPKWRIKIRINSESHSIRNKNLNEWNQHHGSFIKLTSDDKNDLICEFFLPKSTPAQALWTIGWGVSRTYAVALNIATKGFFWWHIPKDRSRYYEEMWDLERSMRMGVQINPQLSTNFKDLHWVLNKEDLGRTSLIFYYITKVRGKKEVEPFDKYALGLSFLAKNDIHLRFEYNAYDSFFLAFKSAFQISGDWDGKSDFMKAVHKQFSKMEDFANLDEAITLGEGQQQSPTSPTSKLITLTEVF
jgi:AbiV family abortive infection protein